MRVFTIRIIVLGTVFLIAATLFAQQTPYHADPVFGTEISLLPQPPYDFGDILGNELLMTEFPGDTNATAVILFDFGSVYIDGDQNVIFQRHRRIKILKPEGIRWGTHEIPYYTGQITQYVRGIAGISVNLTETGTSTIHNLKQESIVTERISSQKNKVIFTLPSVRPGTVVEYRYEVVSENPTQLQYWDFQTSPELKRRSPVEYRYDLLTDQPGLVPDWNFQTTEPVLWSEYNLRVPEFLEYAYVVSSNQPFHISESKEYIDGPLRFHRGISYRWVRKDMPAIREEPFITTLNDYVSKIGFQLAAWYHPQGTRIQVMDTWEELVDRMARARELGGQASPRRSIRRLTSSLVDDIPDPAERIEKLYEYVKTTVEWNGEYSVFTSDRVDRIHETESGNSADIALLLVSMLRAADIDAYPVILSTRDHGKIQHLYPMRQQFNHVIAYAVIDDNVFLLDPTDPLCPVNVLPYNTLNETGLLIKRGEKANWIPINPNVKYSSNITGWLNVDEEATLTASMLVTHEGYGAVSGRRILIREGEVEFIQSLLGNIEATLTVDSLNISGKEEIYYPLNALIEFSTDDYIVKDGEKLYVNPAILGGIDENPFQLRDRTFPVDFAFQRESALKIDIMIPDGYEVIELPRSTEVNLRDDSAQYIRRVGAEDGVVSFHRTFVINKTIFPPGEYRRLRNFFNQVVALESQQIVLQRKDGITVGELKREE